VSTAVAHQLDGAFAALADPTRRRVIELLRNRPRRAGELAAALRMSPPAMSRHLRVLLARKLIEDERVEGDARVRLFRLRREPFQDLRAWLDQVESFWTEQLGAFHAHVERTRKGRRK
jgi:DNA-binding transcriptional ArsR family regulator